MKIPFGPSQGLRDVESDTNDEMKEYDDGWQVEENSYKMLVKDIQPLSYQEVAEDWENNFELVYRKTTMMSRMMMISVRKSRLWKE